MYSGINIDMDSFLSIGIGLLCKKANQQAGLSGN